MSIEPAALPVSASFALSIVVPVYNGARSVPILVEALAGLEIEGGHEIILVNDGSPDTSFDVCLDLTHRQDVPVTLVNLARNFGEHNAIMAGLVHARGDYIITMDDDLQNPPGEVKKLYTHAFNHKYDIVYTFYSKKEHAWWRNFGSKFTNWCADILIDKPKGLYMSSFRCMSRFVSVEIVSNSGPFPYIDGLIMQVTNNIGRVEVKHLPRSEGKSNYTLSRLMKLWASMFLNFSVMPLRMSGLLGLLICFLGTLGFLVILTEWLSGRTPEGYASIASSVLLLSGVQLVTLGLIGEYLGRLFLTANRKPQFVVRAVYRPPVETAAAARHQIGDVATT